MNSEIGNTNTRIQRGFTLLELLTVVGIIGMLAAVAIPGLRAAMATARANTAMQQARQIALGLNSYAMENGGIYPEGTNPHGEAITTSNAAFRSLYGYVNDERIFSVKGSNWGSDADMRMSRVDEFLQPGENHFSYVMGLDTLSNPAWPLIVDGTDGNGAYSSDRKAKGGLREGRRAVLIRCDGSASVERLTPESGGRRGFLPRDGMPLENALDVGYMGGGVRLLDPEG